MMLLMIIMIIIIMHKYCVISGFLYIKIRFYKQQISKNELCINSNAY